MAEVSVITQSAITCPNCGSVKAETMPIDAFQFFYICNGCGETLHPPCAAVRNVRKPAGERTAGFRRPVAAVPPSLAWSAGHAFWGIPRFSLPGHISDGKRWRKPVART